jgi:hypothetical protein
MSGPQLTVGVAILVLVAAIFALMVRSWRRRARRGAAIGAPAAAPAGLGAPFAVLEGLHLGTTLAGLPLERVVIAPFGFRARGVLELGADGIQVRLDGGDPAFIPPQDVVGRSRASWTIDRGVEEDGLNRLTWRLNGTELDSYYRMREPEAFDTAIDRLLTERTPV